VQVITSEKIPIKMWATDIDDNALDQCKNLANHPKAVGHIAIMADAHFGNGMPIGGVVAVKDAVIPNAIGADAGCGMCAVKTSLKYDQVSNDQYHTIEAQIRRDVPVGFSHHTNKDIIEQNVDLLRKVFGSIVSINDAYKEKIQDIAPQLGTLGSGNHFLELQKDENGYVWIMIHTGSRNFGYKMGQKYDSLAREYCADIELPDADLAYLPVGEGIECQDGNDCLIDLSLALAFARESRFLILDTIKNAIAKVLGTGVLYDEVINIHHNYASYEVYNGDAVFIHRKGATFAGEGNIGIIPGDQGSHSYIVKGLGSVDSFCSSSHGAGRVLSRTKARKVLDIETEKRKMIDAGVIIHNVTENKDLDEAPGAYKDIEMVMANQTDLVDIMVKLSPLVAIKDTTDNSWKARKKAAKRMKNGNKNKVDKHEEP